MIVSVIPSIAILTSGGSLLNSAICNCFKCVINAFLLGAVYVKYLMQYLHINSDRDGNFSGTGCFGGIGTEGDIDAFLFSELISFGAGISLTD